MSAHLFASALLVTTNPVVHYFYLLFHQDPFRGLYQPNAFDLAIEVPYFGILIILSIYGVHRYFLTYLYVKNKGNAPAPKGRFQELPRITVQLPVYNEQYVVERLVEAAIRLDYPRELLEIQLLDDSTDDTRMLCAQLAADYAEAGYPIKLYHRTNRHGFKAGALEEGLEKATGELVAIFDADFVPPPGILKQMVDYFTDPKVGMVQGRWTWINQEYSALTEVESIMLDGHFVVEHGGRNFSGRFFNFNGTAGMWRRAAIEDAGGWKHDTLTEDTDLSYRAQLKGWKFIYDPKIVCPSELPVEMNSFKTQQARWAKGLIQVAKKVLPLVWGSDEPLFIKLEATMHLTSNIAYPLMVLFSLILLPAMIVRFYQGWFQMLYLDLPLFIGSTCTLSAFYVVSQRELYPRDWWKRAKFLPFLMATGVGLSITNGKAVMEALLGVQSSFVRTPKYRVEACDGGWEQKKYVRKRSGWIPLAELALAAYFVFTTGYSIWVQNYLTTPFLALFLIGYSYMGTMSLLQTPLRRLWYSLPGFVRVRDSSVSPAT